MMSVFLVANTLLLMNFLETFNHAAFLLINADHDAHPLCIAMAIFLAEYLIVLFFVGLLAYLCVHHRRNWRVWAVVAGSILLAVGITYLLRKGWYHPRPFTLPLGNQFLQHSTSSSLPSKHLISVAAACAGLWLLPVSRLMSVLAAVTVALVAWSRIYLGVHWPLDMLAAGLVGGLSAWAIKGCVTPWPAIRIRWRKIGP